MSKKKKKKSNDTCYLANHEFAEFWPKLASSLASAVGAIRTRSTAFRTSKLTAAAFLHSWDRALLGCPGGLKWLSCLSLLWSWDWTLCQHVQFPEQNDHEIMSLSHGVGQRALLKSLILTSSNTWAGCWWVVYKKECKVIEKGSKSSGQSLVWGPIILYTKNSLGAIKPNVKVAHLGHMHKLPHAPKWNSTRL